MSADIRVAVLTVSDGVAGGTRADTGGRLLAGWAAGAGRRLVEHVVLADETAAIATRLAAWCDAGDVDVIVTTGGTGLTARDVTPEATQAVVERVAPGIAEAIRAHGVAGNVYASLSRGIAGVRARTLIVNLPGSEGGVRDGIAVLDRLAPHAVQLLRGHRTDRHPSPEA